jgi:hypothetical protein
VSYLSVGTKLPPLVLILVAFVYFHNVLNSFGKLTCVKTYFDEEKQLILQKQAV